MTLSFCEVMGTRRAENFDDKDGARSESFLRRQRTAMHFLKHAANSRRAGDMELCDTQACAMLLDESDIINSVPDLINPPEEDNAMQLAAWRAASILELWRKFRTPSIFVTISPDDSESTRRTTSRSGGTLA